MAFSGCSRWGLLFVTVHGLLILVASLVEHRLWVHGLRELQHMGSVVAVRGPWRAQASVVVALGFSCRSL